MMSENKNSIYIIVLCLMLASISGGVCRAEDIFYAQDSIGSFNGSNCANAKAISSLTWNGGVGSVDAGDTAHLCGTIISGITVGASGRAGSPIVFKFENGAKMSAANWAVNRPITIVGKNNIIVDGGTNGVIEATDTGTALGSQTAAHAIHITGIVGNIEVKNLRIDKMYVRTPGTNAADFGGSGVAIWSATGDNILIHNNTMSYMGVPIYINEAHLTNVKIYSNTLSHARACMIIASTTNGQYFNDSQIYGNTMNLYDDGSNSTCTNTPYHGDVIHTWHYNGATMNNVAFYGNRFGPNNGACLQTSGWLFIEGHATNTLIYNNLFLGEKDSDSTNPTNGMLFLKCSGAGSPFYCTYNVYNNTFLATSVAGSYFTAIAHRTSSGSSNIQNNIFVHLRYGIYYEDGTIVNKNNLYYNIRDANVLNSTMDTKYYIGNPLLNASFAPQVGSAAINNGINLSAYFTTDFAGTARPQSAAWDIGAYKANVLMLKPNPPGSISIP